MDTFRGSPWQAKPTEEWNQLPYWDTYYRELIAHEDHHRRDLIIRREVDLLIRMLTNAGELPRRSPGQMILDAGCGISVIPHILAYWGLQVTAVDSCSRAIEVASRHHPSEQELAKCVTIWCPVTDGSGGAFELVDDPTRSLQRLRSFQAPGGSVRYLAYDWWSEGLATGTFGAIYCRNSLRCSVKPYWRRSLNRFRELLAPGGVLLLENVNAIGIQDEVEELLREHAFSPLPDGGGREPSEKYVIAVWPTG